MGGGLIMVEDINLYTEEEIIDLDIVSKRDLLFLINSFLSADLRKRNKILKKLENYGK